jgi:hypothetical protein
MAVLKRLFGIILVLFAAASLLVSLITLVQVWRLRYPVLENLQSGLDVISATLETTSEGLAITGQSLDSLQASVTALAGTVDTLGKTLDDTTPMVQTLIVLTGKDMPESITTAQTSLDAAQQAAKIIDTFLRALTFLVPSAYNPAVPLDVALGDLSDSLDGLPQDFHTIETSLKDTQLNLIAIQIQIDLISGQIGQINTSLADAQKVVSQYELLVTRLAKFVAQIQARLPFWVDTTTIALTFFLIWLAIIQFDFIGRGWKLARSIPRPG